MNFLANPIFATGLVRVSCYMVYAHTYPRQTAPGVTAEILSLSFKLKKENIDLGNLKASGAEWAVDIFWKGGNHGPPPLFLGVREWKAAKWPGWSSPRRS